MHPNLLFLNLVNSGFLKESYLDLVITVEKKKTNSSTEPEGTLKIGDFHLIPQTLGFGTTMNKILFIFLQRKRRLSASDHQQKRC